MLSLSDLDRGALLRLARQAIIEAVSNESFPQQIPLDGIFAERRGVFVTLHIRQRLRGCIGVTEALDPLGDNIVRCAVSAALQDPRFTPVRFEEIAIVVARLLVGFRFFELAKVFLVCVAETVG